MTSLMPEVYCKSHITRFYIYITWKFSQYNCKKIGKIKLHIYTNRSQNRMSFVIG